MPLHEELFRDVERKKGKLGSLPRKLFRYVYTFLRIKLLFQKNRKLNRLHDYCWKRIKLSPNFYPVPSVLSTALYKGWYHLDFTVSLRGSPIDEAIQWPGLLHSLLDSVFPPNLATQQLRPCDPSLGPRSSMATRTACLIRKGIFSHSSTDMEETRATP